MLYTFNNLTTNTWLYITVLAPVVTISTLFDGSEWYERECVEMLGVDIIDLLDNRNLLLPYGYDLNPIKKNIILWGHNLNTELFCEDLCYMYNF
jgi:NADH:ubiquinone oxidoreductase subunit C